MTSIARAAFALALFVGGEAAADHLPGHTGSIYGPRTGTGTNFYSRQPGDDRPPWTQPRNPDLDHRWSTAPGTNPWTQPRKPIFTPAERPAAGSLIPSSARMNAAYIYIVRYWIAPGAETRVLAWLDGGHTAEMAALPGFLWARRVRFEEVDALGWRSFATIYGLESKAALDAYFANPIRERFQREQAAFAGCLRAERSWGPAEWWTPR